MPRRAVVLALVSLGTLLLAPSARAEEPVLTVRGLGTWDEALVALRADLSAQGRTIHVGVRSGEKTVACDHYRLVLDAAAQEAFRVGPCDRDTDETVLVLDRRPALFDHHAHVPRPRTLSVTALVTYAGTAVARGGPQGGSALRCSWAVRPYLEDQEHGTRVLLTPEHYTLRSGSAWVAATPDAAGWNLTTSEAATFHLEYEVVEKATGEVVVRQKMDLTCGPTPDAAPPAPPPAPPAPPAPLPFRVHRWDSPPAPKPPASHRRSGTSGLVIAFGVLHGVVAGTSTGLLVASAATTGNTQNGLQIVGACFLPAAALSAVFLGMAIHFQVKDPQRAKLTSAPLRVHLAPTDGSRGAVLGLAGSF
jgi:hypothetical protein